MEIVGEAHSFSEGIQMMAEIKPEVLLAEKESMESGRGLFLTRAFGIGGRARWGKGGGSAGVSRVVFSGSAISRPPTIIRVRKADKSGRPIHQLKTFES
jgi:hypothetical protein